MYAAASWPAISFADKLHLANTSLTSCAMNEKLVIEIDGGQHQLRSKSDSERTNWLEAQGFRVIRFWNNQVLAETEAVLEAILREMQGEDSPSPPHRVRGRL